MQFGPWYPLDGGAAHAPIGRGVFQVRAPALLDYPTGKTAMVHYELASDVKSSVAAYAAAHAGRGWLCRHLEEIEEAGAPDRIDALYARLLRDFRARFGCEPTEALA
jgi:hypothetical protein